MHPGYSHQFLYPGTNTHLESALRSIPIVVFCCSTILFLGGLFFCQASCWQQTCPIFHPEKVSRCNDHEITSTYIRAYAAAPGKTNHCQHGRRSQGEPLHASGAHVWTQFSTESARAPMGDHGQL